MQQPVTSDKMFQLVRTRKKAGLGQLLSPGSHAQGSISSFQDFIPGHLAPKRTPPAPPRPQWSLVTTSIVKELGQGFYSKVYLAQDTKGVFVALKTVDIQKTSGAEECISNEIDILTTVGSHLNIVKLLGECLLKFCHLSGQNSRGHFKQMAVMCTFTRL